MTNKNIEQAINCFNDKQSGLAKAVGVTQGMVSGWLNGRYQITWEQAKKIETVTSGKVTRHELRPDIFGEAPSCAS